MEKDKIFFAESGLTTTSANYVANLAKEAYQATEEELDNLKFYSVIISVIGASDSRVIRKGDSAEVLDTINTKLHEIAQLKSLIAWLREAIKAKERLIKEACALDTEECCKALGLEYPKTPYEEPFMTEEDYLATLTVKERNFYLELDTKCAVIGSYIHPNGHFSQERKRLNSIIAEPYEVTGTGRDTLIREKVPSINPEEADEAFFSLQQLYRSYQATLNSLKHQMEMAINNDEQTKKAEYIKKATVYNNAVDLINEKVAEYRKSKILEAQNLKITIPNSLLAIYNSVSKMGK